MLGAGIKTITLLGEVGFKVDAVDLTGFGVHLSDTNSIRSLAQYVKPLTDSFDKLGGGKKVCALPPYPVSAVPSHSVYNKKMVDDIFENTCTKFLVLKCM